MTRISSTIASSILRKFSAWRSSRDENWIDQLGHALDDMRDVDPEEFPDPLDGVCVSSTMS